jgi:ribosomal protein S18 acetylase RimI-like enzyme
MIKASVEQKNLIVDILVNAFKDNQSVNFIVKQDEKRIKRISALMDYSFEVCRNFGEVWLADNQQACALTLYPHLKRFSIRGVWLDIKLIFQAIGLSGIFKAAKREAKIKDVQPDIPRSYLWFIGVNPSVQKSGLGSQLLHEIIDHANFLKLPVYLETSTVVNIPWYQCFGFEIYDELDLSYTLYFLKRRPDKI